jgi:hypothetical protein
MNPFTCIANISRNSQSNSELINRKNNDNYLCSSPEIIAVIVFAGIFVIIRLIETYMVPLIPDFLTREVSALFRWGPILIPIIFGITYFSRNNKKTIKHIHSSNSKIVNNISNDNVLKERMMLWTKK